MRVRVDVPAERAELVVAAAVPALGTGCQEDDRPGEVALTFWVPPARAGAAAATLSAIAGVPAARDDEDRDWQGAMRAFHRPVDVAGVLRVRPPWEPALPGVGDVVIDPGMAFGTGQHDTTRGCLELLCEIPPQPAADIGCGSGVLAIAARRLGFDPVLACDVDPLAVDATLANARANGVSLAVSRRAIGVDPLPRAPVVLANLTADLLGRLADALAADPPRHAVLSGLRPAEAYGVLARWAALGLRPAGRRETAEWTALRLAA